MKCKPNTEMWSAGFKAQGHWYGGETGILPYKNYFCNMYTLCAVWKKFNNKTVRLYGHIQVREDEVKRSGLIISNTLLNKRKEKKTE